MVSDNKTQFWASRSYISLQHYRRGRVEKFPRITCLQLPSLSPSMWIVYKDYDLYKMQSLSKNSVLLWWQIQSGPQPSNSIRLFQRDFERQIQSGPQPSNSIRLFQRDFERFLSCNSLTVIAFCRDRYLCKRTTYLVISLAVADMLCGGNSALELFYDAGGLCNMSLFCSYHILTSSVIYYWTDARQLEIYLFYVIKN